MSLQAIDARLIRVIEVPRQRWRNGGGWTRELLALPDAQAWQVRISIADIESDGPFSVFAGVERWFAVLQGRGVDLDVDGRVHRLTPQAAPLRFPGEAATTCRLLDGPTRDLNLMLRGAMAPVTPGARWSPPAGSAGLFTTAAGRASADDASIDVPAQALLWFDRAPTSLRFNPLQVEDGSFAGWWLAAELARGDA